MRLPTPGHLSRKRDMKLHHTTTQAALVAAMYLFFAPLAFGATDNGTLTVGTLTQVGQCFFMTDRVYYGWVGGSIGSYSPTLLTGSKVVNALYEHGCVNPNNSLLIIGNFASDPGTSWLTSVTCNGVTKLRSAASSYNYSSGQAYWTWSGTFGFQAVGVGNNASCSITHN